MLERVGSLEVVSAVLGHASLAITADVYAAGGHSAGDDAAQSVSGRDHRSKSDGYTAGYTWFEKGRSRERSHSSTCGSSVRSAGVEPTTF